MAELSELQAQAERLDRTFAGAHLERFESIVAPALKTATPAADAAYHHPLAFVGRRGLYLLADFGVLTFVVDLAESGRLGVEGGAASPPSSLLARWRFTDSRALVLTDGGAGPRAGVWVVAGNPERQAPLDGLGPDANDVSPVRLVGLFGARPMALHRFLRSQQAVAGLGDRLANEVCHRAKLSPFTVTAELTLDDAEGVVEAIHACVNEDLADERGRDDMGRPDDRAGRITGRGCQRCPDCGDVIRRVEHGTSLVSYCPSCQTGGRV